MAYRVDPRAARALALQLERRDEALNAGAVPVGWKLGVGDAERIGDELSVGHLTTATLLAADATFEASTASLSADAEVTLLLGRDLEPVTDAAAAQASIAGYAAALEIVDLANASAAQKQ